MFLEISFSIKPRSLTISRLEEQIDYIILKKRSKLTIRYYANPTDYNEEMLLYQVSEYTKLIVEAKDKNLAKLSSKLDNPDTAPKSYWSIINRFLNKKKIPIIPPVLFEGKLISDFEKNVLWSKM